MLSIGDFARHGRVSVRMLRHYDLLGLLVPDRVDPVSGYRFYEVGQLARLNRIIALKELGFTLDQVGRLLNDAVTSTDMRGMLICAAPSSSSRYPPTETGSPGSRRDSG